MNRRPLLGIETTDGKVQGGRIPPYGASAATTPAGMDRYQERSSDSFEGPKGHRTTGSTWRTGGRPVACTRGYPYTNSNIPHIKAECAFGMVGPWQLARTLHHVASCDTAA
jgi:hypothetical protein